MIYVIIIIIIKIISVLKLTRYVLNNDYYNYDSTILL